MKKRAVLYLILFSLLLTVLFSSLVASQEIELTLPDEVEIGEEFSVSLKLIDYSGTDNSYDVKIDMTDNGVRIGKILNNGEWKSTYYYINDALKTDQVGDFTLRIDNSITSDRINLEIKTRSKSGEIKTYSGYELAVNNGNANLASNADENSEPVKTNNSKSNEPLENKNGEKGNLTIDVIKETTQTKTPEIIYLNNNNNKNKDIKTIVDNGTSYSDKKSKYILYGFVGFFVLLVILFFLKRRNSKYKEII